MPARHAIYLDANAGAPLRAEALAALQSLLAESPESEAGFLPNPSSIHVHGRRGKRLLDRAREQVAGSLGARSTKEITFTASGTEAAELAIRSVLEPLLLKGLKPHWITTPVEHDCVARMASWLEARGGSVSLLPVDSSGRPRADALGNLLRPETALISLIWVNNETGVITPVEEFANVLSETRRDVKLHLDGAQAWGKLDFKLTETGAHYASFAGHKIGGPAGTGVLWSATTETVMPFVFGSQERGRRGGTENILGIVPLGAAALATSSERFRRELEPLRELLELEIKKRFPWAVINGATAPRVPNTCSVSFPGAEADALLIALDLEGFAVSAGSACGSGSHEPSRVLLALGRSHADALSTIRISLWENTRAEDLRRFVQTLENAMARFQTARTTNPAVHA